MKNDRRESTLKDVAKLAGVSIATVSRVVHGIKTALEKITAWQGARFDASVHAPFESVHELAGMEHAINISNRYNR